MTALPLVQRPPRRPPIPSRPPRISADLVGWTLFALAAGIFVLDAVVTIEVLAVQPLAVEQNPIARWTLEAHPLAPYLLKAAIVGECAVIVTALRRLDEGWAAALVTVLMATAGAIGIGTALLAVG